MRIAACRLVSRRRSTVYDRHSVPASDGTSRPSNKDNRCLGVYDLPETVNDRERQTLAEPLD